MTNAELDTKIAETMDTLRSDNLSAALKKAWKAYSDDLKEEAKKKKRKGEKLAQAMERLEEISPCELYCYIMFNNDGSLNGWTIEHQQYWQGNSGPSTAISYGTTSYEDVEREIENDLSQAFDIED